jgi:hypothetical protein
VIPLLFTNKLFADKRVDALLKKKTKGALHIYYSPIKIWLQFLLYLSIPLVLVMLLVHYWAIYIVVIAYIIAAYLMLAKHNCSLAIDDTHLYIVNSNWPFVATHTYAFNTISNVEINIEPELWMQLWLMSPTSEIKITSSAGIHTYYCNGLDIEYLDENYTEHSIEDFYKHLLEHNISCALNIEGAEALEA